jgi:quinone-modifying oxidoreductase subunit QmoA
MPLSAEVRAGAVETAPSVHRSILVVGGGIAGITAAVEAAEVGYEAYIVEKNAYLGGRVAQLYKYFPKLCPPYCGLEINFQRIKKQPGIHIFTLAEVEKLSGRPGNFEVTVRLRPRYVNERCTACNACVEVCPVDRPNRFNFGMGKTKAIYLPHEMAFPMKYVIDDSACQLTQCAKCVEVCGYHAIDLAMGVKTVTLRVGAVIFATGWDPYNGAKLDNLGGGRFPNVITNVMLERIAAPNGPTKGKILRPSDGKPVESAAFVQCAGSRDVNHLGYCSSICCLASLKEATYLRQQNPNSRVYIFYIDLRTPGTYEMFSRRVQSDQNIEVMKGKVAKIVEDPETKDLILEAEDVLSAEKRGLRVDLVVLATGMASSLTDGKPAGPVRFDQDHFIVTDSTPGIFAAGCARGPMDVATTTQDAAAAALKAIQAIQTAAQRSG